MNAKAQSQERVTEILDIIEKLRALKTLTRRLMTDACMQENASDDLVSEYLQPLSRIDGTIFRYEQLIELEKTTAETLASASKS